MSKKIVVLALVASRAFAAPTGPETYKTADGTVVVTGLQPTQRYQIRMVDAQGKPGTRQDKSANSCGEVVVEKAATYQAMNVGTHSVDPASLPVKERVKCQRPAAHPGMQPKGVEIAKAPTPVAKQ
jgi:hypothetical protein